MTVQSKRALFIGIDQYKRNPLDGCVNDVEMMRDLLTGEKFAFPKPSNTALIKNSRATRQGILDAFDKLIDDTQPDDIVVIHYAGHGSQMYPEQGVLGDEASGLANTIVPVDTDRAAQINRDITDDEINAVLERLSQKTPYVTLIFDCCHSATITRDVVEGKSRRIDAAPARADAPALGASTAARASGKPGPSGWLPLADSYVLIAGCRDEETSFETPPGRPAEPHGALSWFLHEALAEAPHGTTYRELFERVAPRVTRLYAGEPQHPQLEGRIDRELFGTRVAEPPHFIGVADRLDDVVTLRAGTAMGIAPGTRWTVLRPDSKSATADAVRGEVTITDVRAVESTARIVAGTDKGIVERCRAVEGAASYGGKPLRVVVESSPAFESNVRELLGALGGSPWVRVEATNTGGPAEVIVRARSAAATTDSPNPVSYWEIESAGHRVSPPSPSLGAIDDVRANLETIARYRHALSLENPASSLRNQIELTVQRLNSQREWEPAAANADGVIEFRDGDHVGFVVQNNASMILHIALLDFSRSGAIGQLHPPRGAHERVAPGVRFGIGMDPRKRRIRLAAEPNAIADAETFSSS